MSALPVAGGNRNALASSASKHGTRSPDPSLHRRLIEIRSRLEAVMAAVRRLVLLLPQLGRTEAVPPPVFDPARAPTPQQQGTGSRMNRFVFTESSDARRSPMRTMTIIAVSSLALASSPALAQLSSPGGMSPTHATAPAPIGSAAPAAPKAPAANPLNGEDVSLLSGTDVYGSSGHKIGSISTALMNPQTKKIDRLVVSAGGLLGIGAHRVALPVGQFTWEASKGGFMIADSEQQLKSMPEWHDTTQAMNGSAASPVPAGSAGTTSH